MLMHSNAFLCVAVFISEFFFVFFYISFFFNAISFRYRLKPLTFSLLYSFLLLLFFCFTIKTIHSVLVCFSFGFSLGSRDIMNDLHLCLRTCGVDKGNGKHTQSHGNELTTARHCIQRVCI